MMDIINHFRHRNGEAHGERETPEHLAMKKRFYDLFPQRVELERRVESLLDPSGFRVADVVIDNFIVVECQCAPISVYEMNARNQDYTSAGLCTVWVLGGACCVNAKEYKTEYGRKGPYKIQKIRGVDYHFYWKCNQPSIYMDDTGAFFVSKLVHKQRRGSDGECSTKGWFNLRFVPDKFVVNWLEDVIGEEKHV